MVEQRPFKPKVVGSIPTAPTCFLFHSKGLANSARQQKAAIANLAGSASSVTGCGMDGKPTNYYALEFYIPDCSQRVEQVRSHAIFVGR